jgi:hypothetical protein
LFQELWHLRQRTRVVVRGIVRLALQLKHAAKIVADLGVIGPEDQHALIEAHRIVEFARTLAFGRFENEVIDLFAGRIGPMACGRRAMLLRGAALLSVHRL